MTAIWTLDELELPDFLWENEFDDNRIDTRVMQALAGNPIIYEGAMPIAGQNIDLTGDADGAIMRRDLLKSLFALSSTPNQTHTLTYNGSGGQEIYTVRFRSEEIPVIEYTPHKLLANPDDTAIYHSIRIKLMRL